MQLYDEEDNAEGEQLKLCGAEWPLTPGEHDRENMREVLDELKGKARFDSSENFERTFEQSYRPVLNEWMQANDARQARILQLLADAAREILTLGCSVSVENPGRPVHGPEENEDHIQYLINLGEH